MDWIKQIGRIVLLFLLQGLVFNHLTIGAIGIPMVYIYCLLALPGSTKKGVEVCMAAAVGLLMDMIYSSPGVHMAACTAIGFVRPLLLSNRLQDFERFKGTTSSHTIGSANYILCVVLMTLLHHSIVFFLETWNITQVGFTLLQIGISSILTISFLLLFDVIKR